MYHRAQALGTSTGYSLNEIPLYNNAIRSMFMTVYIFVYYIIRIYTECYYSLNI